MSGYTIAPETEIVGSAFDPQSGVCSYTAEREGRRWTVTAPLADFEKLGPIASSKMARRNHLATLVRAAMTGPDDQQKAAA